MEKEFGQDKMVQETYMRVNMQMIRKVVMEHIYGLVVISILDNISMI